jgi:mannose-6-phosphate isomerase-like protein (cupin superfamily)
MQTFELDKLLAGRGTTNKAWLEFFRISSLSMGVYCLKAGQIDPQQPHTEDEVYYVVSGAAQFQCNGEQRTVRPGTIIFVERLAEHRFLDVTEDLTALVFFAPAEGSVAGKEST